MDKKMKELIAIGASVAAHCQPCLKYHLQKAEESGLKFDKIKQAIEIGEMIEKGSMKAMREFSKSIIDEISESQIPCSCGGNC